MSAIAFFILVLMVMDMSYCKSLHELADLKAVSSGASHYPDSSSNRTWVLESGKELTKPYVMSENTLSGKSDVIGIDRILFPASYSNLPQPLRNIINTIIRIPVIVAGLIVGENAELIGLQAMQVGNALLMMGSHNFGYTLRDYAIGFIAFGKTVKEWFVYNNIPALNDTGVRPTIGYFWNKIGDSYLQTRLEVEMMYGAHF